MSESMDLLPISPTRPVAPWMGGKRNLAATIIREIEGVPHDLYAEPFIGMGGVFFRRSFRPKAEVVNDINRDVVTLFRVLQRHYTPFTEMIRWQLSSRAEFERLSSIPPDTLTDLERAARFLYLQRTCFGGKVSGINFGVSPDRPSRFDVGKIIPMLEDIHDRLTGVTIERLPYAEFIARYDRPATLFYLDPPYWGNETDYGTGIFNQQDFQVLASLLKEIKGRFLMTLNDRKEVRECFAGFRMMALKTTYTIAEKSAKKVGEVLIRGGGG